MIYLLPVALVVGVIAHELCHAVAVKLVGGDLLRINLWKLFVDYRVSTSLEESIVRHAPFIFGMCLTPLFLQYDTLSSEALLDLSLWIALTLTGGDGEIGIVP